MCVHVYSCDVYFGDHVTITTLLCLVKVLHDVMSLLLLTGPLWWLPLSQLHVVGVEGEREEVEGERGMGRRESYK